MQKQTAPYAIHHLNATRWYVHGGSGANEVAYPDRSGVAAPVVALR
jgi:hypothetical protein